MAIRLKGQPPLPPEQATRKLTAADVRSWMQASKKSFRAASSHFGVPEYEIRSLLGAASGAHPGHGPGRAGSEPWTPGPGEPLPGSSDEAALLMNAITPPDVEAIDPAKATTQEFYEWRLRYAVGMVQSAVRSGAVNVARNWEAIAQQIRKALDEHMEDLARKAAESGRGDITDPVDVARRVLNRADPLVNLAPDECRALAERWGIVLRFKLAPLDDETPVTKGAEDG